MLSTGGLLVSGAGAGRRQAWAWWPLFTAAVLGRLLGLLPTIFIFARFLRRGLNLDSSSTGFAFLLGAFTEDDPKLVGAVAGLGTAIGITGAWLLSTVVSAGVLRQLAVQTGRLEGVSDDAFAEGVTAAPASYLVAGVLAEFLKFFVTFGAIGAVVAGGWYFIEYPGTLAAFAMTVAVGLVCLIPATVAALEIGFARAVILSEGPITALGEGLALAGRRVSDYLTAWYVLAFAEVVLAAAVGFSRIGLGNRPGDNAIWILHLGPLAALWLAGVAVTTGVEFWRLGVAATLVAEDSGMMPEPAPPPPPVPHIEPIFEARVVEPDVGEMILEAREIAPPPDDDQDPDPQA